MGAAGGVCVLGRAAEQLRSEAALVKVPPPD